MSESPIRVSDEQREKAIARLTTALTEGRLALPDFDERTAAATRATTSTDLAALTADLPEPEADRKRRNTREWLTEWRYWLAGALIMNAIWSGQWLADGNRPDYWPAAPLSVWAGILIALVVWPRTSDH